MNIIIDPTDDRSCVQRWAHRDEETLDLDGFLVCAACSSDMNKPYTDEEPMEVDPPTPIPPEDINSGN